MNFPSKDSIQKATERVKKRLPLKKLRMIPKYQNLTKKEYKLLIKNAEIFALLILQAYITVNNTT